MTETESETEATSSPAVSTTSTKPEAESSGDNNVMSNELDSGRTIIDLLPKNNTIYLQANRSSNEIPKVEKTGKEKEIKNSIIAPAKNVTEVKTRPGVSNYSKTTEDKMVEVKVVLDGTSKMNGSGEGSGKKALTKPGKTSPERKPEVIVPKMNFTATTPARFFKSNKISFFAEKPFDPLSNDSPFHKGKSKEPLGKEPPEAIKIDRNEEGSGQRIRRIVEIGAPSLGIVAVMILGLFWYRRSRNRKVDRDNMVEDSDVRYLTSDEVLDFTLARPADDDL